MVERFVVERFLSTLKAPIVRDRDQEVLVSPQQLQRYLTVWMKGDDNRVHRHSTIGHPFRIDQEQPLRAGEDAHSRSH